MFSLLSYIDVISYRARKITNEIIVWQLGSSKEIGRNPKSFKMTTLLKDFILTLNVKERISRDYLVYGIIERGNDLFSRSKIIR
jgi:hypothetical protein